MSPHGKYYRKRRAGAMVGAIAAASLKRIKRSFTRRGSGTTTRARRAVRKKTQTATLLAYKKKKSSNNRNNGVISDSYYKWHHPLKKVFIPKGMKKVTARQYYIVSEECRVNCNVGLQGRITNTDEPLFSLWSQKDVTSLFNYAQNLGTGAATTVINPHTQKLYFRRCTYKLMMTNQTNDVAHLTVYYCQPRRDIFSNTSYSTPGDAWSNGAISDLNITGATGGASTVGTTPFSVPGFTEFWKVKKVSQIDMHTGAHHVIRGSSPVFSVFSDEIMQALPASGSNFRGLTSYFLIVVHGYPMNASASTTTISTAACGIDCVLAKQYEYDIFERSTASTHGVSNLPTTVTNPTVFNDLTGALQTLATT